MNVSTRGPARAGLFLYAGDPARIAHFYADLLDLRTLHATDEIIVLAGDGLQLVVHRMPAQFAENIAIQSPPVPRSDTALKFFFTVASLDQAEAKAPALGGRVFGPLYPGPGFTARNACDPEGNIFQVREFASSESGLAGIPGP